MWDTIKDNLPVWIYITLALLVILSGVTYTIFKTIDLIKKRSKNYTPRIDRDTLKNHHFFSEISSCKNYTLKIIQLVDVERTTVMKLLLKHKLETFERRFMDFVSSVDIEDLDSQSLSGIFVALIYSSINEYEEKFKAEATNQSEKELLELILNKFNEVHLKRGNEAIDIIKSIFTVDAQDNYTKVHSALYALLTPFVSLFGDSLRMLYRLNGELSGKKFSGMIFQDLNN